MLDKLKDFEKMDLVDLIEFKKAFLAFELGLTSDDISIKQIEAIEDTVNEYMGNDVVNYFVDERVIDVYNELVSE